MDLLSLEKGLSAAAPLLCVLSFKPEARAVPMSLLNPTPATAINQHVRQTRAEPLSSLPAHQLLLASF